jgi:hypothetical protein
LFRTIVNGPSPWVFLVRSGSGSIGLGQKGRKSIKLSLLVIHHRTIKPALRRGRRNSMPGFGAQAKPFVFHD